MSRMQRSLHLCNFVYQAHILDMRSLQSTGCFGRVNGNCNVISQEIRQNQSL